MSIYEGTPREVNYAHGFDEGHAWGEQDAVLGLGTVTGWLAECRESVTNARTEEARAYALGYMRGYRDAVRTYDNGRWST